VPIAFVTGASRGIGKATAIDLAAAGCDLAISARTLTDGAARLDDGTVVPGGLDTTQAAIESHGVGCLAVPMDLLDRASVDAAVAAVIDRFGSIDILVNNAIYQGPGGQTLWADLTEDDLRKVIEGNVFAQVHIIEKVLPAMLERGGGTIVNIASGAGVVDPPAKLGEGGWGLGYAMSKAAFGRIAPLLHVEYAEQGLRIFNVNPGLIVTERMEAIGTADEYRRHYRAGTPEIPARAILWLATDSSADEYRGKFVDAQKEVAERGLLT
jgi:NAD(P)-dependent dehydrogenase (short-subunit alcohol dehydrogenase family)